MTSQAAPLAQAAATYIWFGFLGYQVAIAGSVNTAIEPAQFYAASSCGFV